LRNLIDFHPASAAKCSSVKGFLTGFREYL
jgi:hypothetical protein